MRGRRKGTWRVASYESSESAPRPISEDLRSTPFRRLQSKLNKIISRAPLRSAATTTASGSARKSKAHAPPITNENRLPIEKENFLNKLEKKKNTLYMVYIYTQHYCMHAVPGAGEQSANSRLPSVTARAARTALSVLDVALHLHAEHSLRALLLVLLLGNPELRLVPHHLRQHASSDEHVELSPRRVLA